MAKQPNKEVQARSKTKQEMIDIREQTVETVLQKIKGYQAKDDLHLPANYSVANAMKSAWLMIQEVRDKDKRLALDVCTTASIANTLLDMAIQGLNPVKKQCYFIVYGKVLTLYRSYLGNIIVAMRVNPKIKNIFPVVVYEGDTLEWSIKNGLREFTEHVQSFTNIAKGNVVGVYAVANDKDDKCLFSEIMTLDQLKEAWAQSKTKPVLENGDLKASSVHARFTDEMAKKTCINRLTKRIIGSSNDETLVVKSAQKTDEIAARTESQKRIALEANKGEIIDIRRETDKADLDDFPHPEDNIPGPDPIPAGDGEMTEDEIAEIKRREMQEDPFKDNDVQDHIGEGRGPDF